MRYGLIIFDMDGTILDTLEDLKESLNYALNKEGYPIRALKEVREFVGNGIRRLIERGVPLGTDNESIDKVQEIFMEHYKAHCADITKPYEGIKELITGLKMSGCRTAVVSNKADIAVRELAEQYFPELFDIYLGEREGMAKKPAPDLVNFVINELGVSKKDTVYIGDSEVDIATAENAGIDCIIVSWGFRDKEFLMKKGAEVIADTTDDILKIVSAGK